MTKYFILFTACLFLHTKAHAEASYDFEAELKLLEQNEMAAENSQMKAVEELSVESTYTPVEDSISLKQSATKKPLPVQEPIAAPIKGRRIRSR